MDLVSEDLLLDNKLEAAEEDYRVRSRNKASRLPRIRKRTATEQSFHYIAYVPVNGRVWELDGFEVQPRLLGMCPLLCVLRGLRPTCLTSRLQALLAAPMTGSALRVLPYSSAWRVNNATFSRFASPRFEVLPKDLSIAM